MLFLRFILLPVLLVANAALVSDQRFDGSWDTTLTCPAKGNTEGYTWHFVSLIRSGVLHGERGVVDQPAWFALDGTVAEDGGAKLTGSGIVASREYARGVSAHKGESYSYEIKAHFEATKGAGTRSTGLGIVGRPCTFDFVKQDSGSH
ncbi:MAG TPA: hypothetical protein VFE06_18635 [Acidobacteriaceae bacterium]|jgi:hypothetical protein|nr:hypothetical protein [Acidobacteriaceae bacterium]